MLPVVLACIECSPTYLSLMTTAVDLVLGDAQNLGTRMKGNRAR